MRATWSIVLLAVLGIAAAVSAALLTVALRVQPLGASTPTQAPEVKVLVAARDIPAFAQVNADAVTQVSMPKDGAPEHYYSEPAQAIGRILASSVIEGQALTRRVFASEGSGQHLAGLLSPGMRAVTVSLADHSGLEGLIYPGCVVDVLAGFNLAGTPEGQRAMSRTLLEGVEVLAVENVTASEAAVASEQPQRSGTARRGLLVTLMVNSKQAEALQLAMDHGSISLAMRNPTDKFSIEGEPTLLSGGRMGAQADLYPAPPEPEPAPIVEEAPKPAPARPSKTVEIIRGISAETMTLPTSL